MKEAGSAGEFEVRAARLAQTNASHPAVKEYAAMLERDHAVSNARLLSLSNARGMAAAPMENVERKKMKKLSKFKGAKFDRAYLEEVGLKTHAQNIQAFEIARRDARDPALRDWIDATLPALRAHLVQAQNLQAALGAQAKGAASKRPSTVARPAQVREPAA